jgi:hypothetical protein
MFGMFLQAKVAIKTFSDWTLATASSNHKHYESTLENVKGYYWVVMDFTELSRYLPPSAPHQTRSKMLRTNQIN